MSENYLIYPTKIMRITQSYNGKTSHLPHTAGELKDYPIDEGCTDSGRDYLYCPCDEMTVVRIYGVGSKGTNTLWLQSEEKVTFADGTKDYFTMLVTHPEDSDLKKLKVGQSFKRKEKICREGKDGATGNHFHISGGKGRMTGNGWAKNTRGKWVLTTEKGSEKPENLFFVDRGFTSVKDTKGLNFRNLGTLKDGYSIGNYIVTAEALNVRKGPSTKYSKKSFSNLTYSAQKKILSLTKGKEVNGYVKGLTFTVYEVRSDWGRTPSGWVNLRYCEEIK